MSNRAERRRAAKIEAKNKSRAGVMTTSAYRRKTAAWLGLLARQLIAARRAEEGVTFVWSDEEVVELVDLLGRSIENADPAQIDRLEVGE